MEYNEEREKRYANAKRYLEMVMFEMRQTPDNPTDPGAELRVYNGAKALINQLRASQKPETSDEALHIGSVGGNEVELCATCQSPLQDNFREGRFCVACNVKFG